MKFIGPRRVLNPTEMEEWFEQELSNPSRFAVSFVESDELIGFCGVKKIENILDFGFYFRKKYWGNGYATEACKLAIEKLKGRVNFELVEVFIACENIASVKVAEKMKFTFIRKGIKSAQEGFYYKIEMYKSLKLRI